MHTFEYILILLAAVLISNVVSERFPRVSTPLIQIAMGAALIFLPGLVEAGLDPSLFMVLFIAPLLFDEAKKADKAELWRLKRPILSLAIVLVFTTVVMLGFAMNWFVPSIPLAAAFAMAAALAPTDAVAVASLKGTASLTNEQSQLLKG